MVWTVMLVTLVSPGIIVALAPLTLMTKKYYVNLMNFLHCILDISGGIVGFQKFNELSVKVYVVMGTIICGSVFVIYFGELDLMYEGLCYTVLVFTAFLMFMDLVGCSYLIIKAGTKKTDDTVEAIGLIIGNSLVISRGVGNIFSILIHEYFPR